VELFFGRGSNHYFIDIRRLTALAAERNVDFDDRKNPRGWNLRNTIAHGLTNRGHLDRSTANFVIHSLLVLGCWRDIADSRRHLEKSEVQLQA
jgi:hypothetical protein